MENHPTENKDEDRPSALLTNAQRRYLRGSEDLSAAQERAIRSRIRERLRNGIIDFSIIFEYLTDDDLWTVFNDLVEDWQGREGLADMLAVFYLETYQLMRFDDLFGRGVRRATRRMLRDDISAIITVKPRDEIIDVVDEETINQALEKLAEDDGNIDDLSDSETRIVLQMVWDDKYRDLELEELREELADQIRRIRYASSGGRDIERKENWMRDVYREFPESREE